MPGTDDATPTDRPAGPDVRETDDATRVRVRGIYTTAVTRLLLAAGHRVVRASKPIRRRFDTTFPVAPETARIDTTDDRQGVAIHGQRDAVRRLRDRLGVAVDTLAWNADAPRGLIADGRVTDTTGGGAVVELPAVERRDADAGDSSDASDEEATDGETTEGYLSFDAADGYVETGDAVRVQVREPHPPWNDDRAVVDATLRASGGLVSLVRGREETRVAGGDGEAARELAGMTELFDVDAPDGWGIEWARDATEADMDALRDALDRASARAERIDATLGAAGAPRPTRPLRADDTTADARPATAWVWFGRESRETLDAHRRAVTTTMPGHHRIKAGSRRASAGVDFAESVATFDDDRFPFAAVTDQFGPSEGDTVRLVHGKPDGRAFSLGRATVTHVTSDGNVTVEREMQSAGTYDGLGTDRERGDTAVTKLREDRWWYPTSYEGSDGTSKGTYVNVCTPVEVFPDAVRYVDLHVDVVKRPDGTVERVDDDELDRAEQRGELSAALADRARAVATAVVRALSD